MRPKRSQVSRAVFLWMAATTVAAAAAEAPRYIVGERAGALAALPFSDGVFVGDTLYLSGRLGLDAATGQAPKDPDAEIKLAMDGIQQTLKASGLTMDDLVSVTVYCTDLSLYDKFNGVYRSYFHGKYPTRAFIGVASLLRGGRFEIQGIAVRSGAGH
jgi:2-iminobutanoate/2-iminopropanoate deaminase